MNRKTIENLDQIPANSYQHDEILQLNCVQILYREIYAIKRTLITHMFEKTEKTTAYETNINNIRQTLKELSQQKSSENDTPYYVKFIKAIHEAYTQINRWKSTLNYEEQYHILTSTEEALTYCYLNDTIEKLIAKYEKPGDFFYSQPTLEQLTDAMYQLQIILPYEFTKFIKEYGGGGLNGRTVEGFYKNKTCGFIEETLLKRKIGLPENLTVIENCDEFVYCLENNTDEIISWSSRYMQKEYENFTDYLVDMILGAAEHQEQNI